MLHNYFITSLDKKEIKIFLANITNKTLHLTDESELIKEKFSRYQLSKN